mgnify:CR=1 FL=1
MGSICIVTDSSAQFPQLGFSGRNDVRVIPFSVETGGKIYEEGHDLKPNDLPATASETDHPRLIAPTSEQLQDLFLSLSQRYNDIIAILASSSLTSVFDHAQKAAKATQGRANVTVIDSQTTSVGLGLMVQAASEAASTVEKHGMVVADIERMIRSMIPHTYMMICTPAMSYLHYAGLIDASQAFVGEMLGLMPIFTLEEGQISAVEKVRNTRSLVDYMQEFVCEFDDLLHIAFLQSIPPLTHEARQMREHAQNCFPQTPYSEHTINLPLSALIGPRSVGLVVVEKTIHSRR